MRKPKPSASVLRAGARGLIEASMQRLERVEWNRDSNCIAQEQRLYVAGLLDMASLLRAVSDRDVDVHRKRLRQIESTWTISLS